MTTDEARPTGDHGVVVTDVALTTCGEDCQTPEMCRQMLKCMPHLARPKDPCSYAKAIEWLLTEMPVDWEDTARMEGRSDVIAAVTEALEEVERG